MKHSSTLRREANRQQSDHGPRTAGGEIASAPQKRFYRPRFLPEWRHDRATTCTVLQERASSDAVIIRTCLVIWLHAFSRPVATELGMKVAGSNGWPKPFVIRPGRLR